MKLSWKKLSLILSLAALVSCGGDNDDDDDPENEQIPQEERVSNFSTRINNNLLIAGTRCDGSETTTDVNGGTVTCARDQWLITLDNINRCTPGGACTEIGVVPFVAELDRTDRVTIPESTFFEIDPISAVSSTQANTVDDYLVRFDILDEQATVIAK
ncbi:MAG: hypothetical protein V4598_17455 [Bdellovibrionota bacterium]